MKRRPLTFGIIAILLLTFFCGGDRMAESATAPAHNGHAQAVMDASHHHSNDSSDANPHSDMVSFSCLGGACATILPSQKGEYFSERATLPNHSAFVSPPLGRAPLPEPNPPRA